MTSRLPQKKQVLLALVPPVVALVLQWLCWPWLRPVALALFYPAAFFSSWIGGLRGGLAGTALSVALVWLCFVPEQLAFGLRHGHVIISLGVFIATGVFFAVLHEKLRKASARLAARVESGAQQLAISRESTLQSEARMEAIVASALDAIISTNSRQEVELFNTAAEAMFGCPAAEALGKPLERFIPPRYREAFHSYVTTLQQTGAAPASTRTFGTLAALRASGEEFPIEASLSHVEVAGRHICTVIIRDITQRKAAEAALLDQQVHTQSLLNFARKLESARGVDDILEAARVELLHVLGLSAVWFYLLTEDRRHLRLVMARKHNAGAPAEAETAQPGDKEEQKQEEEELLLIEGDPMLEEIVSSRDLVVVEDARTDPRTDKDIVARNGNRTILNMPVSLFGHCLGAIGTGTFGAEGTRHLGEKERSYFMALANHAAVALERVRASEKQEQAEEELRRSVARYRNTLDNMMEGCQILGPDMRYLYLNETACRHARKSAAELLGRTMDECFPGIENTIIYADIRRCLDEQRTEQTENLFVYPDGSHAFFQLCIQPVPEGVFVLSLDISERKKVEERMVQINAELEGRVAERTVALEALNAELRSSQAELQSLFDSLPGLYLVLTPEFKIVGVSDAYLKATMTTRGGIMGRGLFEVFPDNPNDPAADGSSNLRASLNRVLKSAVPDTMAIQRYDVRRPDGTFEERFWSPVNSPLLDSAGQVRHIIHRVEDVTEFVQHKQRPLMHDGEPLTEKFQQMEAEIFHSAQKVQAANKLLEAANKELESFSYSVSHDLRAPLRAMDGFSRAVLEDHAATLPEDGRRHLQIIRSNAQRMGQLIDDLLTFSRLSRAPLKKLPVDMRALVLAALEDLGVDLNSSRLDLRLTDMPEGVGDAALLKQVWLNLLSNALKYSRKQETAIIEIGCLTNDGQKTYFVRDNGAGFDMRYAHKLFGVFQRLHRAEDYEGTGVGLAIVQRVIHRHGGRVWAESALGQGATFCFTLEEESPLHEPLSNHRNPAG